MSLPGYATGSLPLGATPDLYADIAAPAWFNALANPVRALLWLFEADLDTPGSEVIQDLPGTALPLGAGPIGGTAEIVRITATPQTYRWASQAFITGAADSPAHTVIQGRLRPSNVRREIALEGQGCFSGLAKTTIGEMELDNGDDALTGLADQLLIEGRPYRLKIAAMTQDAYGRDQAPPLAEFGIITAGTVDSWSWQSGGVRLRLKDASERLDRPLRGDLYGGGGAASGTVTIAGQSRPLAFGRVLNTAGVEVDPRLLIWQFHDGEMRTFDAVYDMGVKLTRGALVKTYDQLAALTVEGESESENPDLLIGQYAACPTIGMIRLGGSPAGRITADLRGSGGVSGREPFSDGKLFSDGTGFAGTVGPIRYVGTAGRLILRICQTYLNLTVAQVELAQMRQVDDSTLR